MYSATLLDHFQNPRNAGDLPEANVRVRVENPVCGDVVELALLIKDSKIEDVRFKARGCVPSVACASLMTELVRGRPIVDAAVTEEALAKGLDGLPQASAHAAKLAVEVFERATREARQLKPVAQRG